MERYEMYFDGSSLGKGRRGGPGPSAGAAILLGPKGEMRSCSVYIRSGDSDCAEYQGLICGLEAALKLDVKAITVAGDSRNVIDAILGRKSLRKSMLLDLRERARSLLSQFSEWELKWIPRTKNALADQEARLCVQRGAGSGL